MAENESMDDLLAGLDPESPTESTPAKQKSASGGKRKAQAAAPKVVEEPEVAKDPKADWPVIILDEEVQGSNFKFVQINGKAYQIQRGVPATVPPEVLRVLNDAVATRIVQRQDPVTGVMTNHQQHYAGTPYRIIKFGKE